MAHQVTSTETLFWRATIEMMTSDTLPKGTILSDRYRIDAFLAEGGMALVYRAHDLRLERDVALKIVKDDFANSPDYQAAFINEAKLAAKVNHPNLVNVFDQGVDGDFDYLVMELVEGKTLREILNKFGKIESNRALDVIAAVLAGLSALHRAGVIHRDVKPENIILANDGRIKVTDFGLARPASMAQSAAAPLLGTVAYISPEALRGQSVDARSDLYAVGIVLFELLTGEQPFNAEDSRAVARMHLQERVPAPSSLNPAISTEVDALVLKSTNQSAEARFESASSMLNEVKRAVSSGDDSNQTRVISNETELIDNRTELISADGLDELDPEPKRERRFRNWVVLTLSAVLLGLGLGWWFGVGPGAVITVPNLVAMTESEVASATELLPIKVTTEDENSDAPIGTVTRTDPASGSLILRDGTLTVYLSIGPKLNKVPELKGKNLIEATAALRAANFWVGSTSQAFSEQPLGTIYDYTGSDGSVIEDGSSIDLKISLGPLPAVQGVALDVAKTLITAVGLKVGTIDYAYSDTYAKGQVISLVPKTADIAKGGTVDLTVSKGSDLVVMPQVVGETISASKLALEQLGLKVIVDTNALSSRWGIVKVKSCSAAVGSQLRIGDTVTIVAR
jgi:serine/threonine-protein kinase